MKEFTVPIADAHLDLFFSPIRRKEDIIRLLMNTIKYAHSNIEISGEIKSKFKIIIDDMNRIVYESEGKIFSIRSPFYVKSEQNRLHFYTKNIPDIDNVISSRILSFINDDRFNSPNSLEFIEPLEELFEDPDRIWAFVHELMLFEDGYLRFDYDPENENGRLHPLSHLDICYTTASTYKIGTYNPPCANYLVQLLNGNENAKYLEKS
ncbi:TPA: hypothetical protein I7141_12880 [Vibrio vulnificus]|nr:hypothetical protein [Vibrio parahaemolyticus]HAS6076777.1 hypothetical protein [Vibrio vulnificus]